MVDESGTQVASPIVCESWEMVSVGTGPGVVLVHGGGPRGRRIHPRHRHSVGGLLALAADRSKQAMLLVSRGLRNPGSTWPERIHRAAVSVVLLTPQVKTMARLLPTVPAESRLAFEADGLALVW